VYLLVLLCRMSDVQSDAVFCPSYCYSLGDCFVLLSARGHDPTWTYAVQHEKETYSFELIYKYQVMETIHIYTLLRICNVLK